MERTGRHGREGPCRCGGLATLIQTPAANRSVAKHAAAVGPEPRRHRRELALGRVALTETEIIGLPPAGKRSVTAHRACVVLARRQRRENTARGCCLPTRVVAPTFHCPVGAKTTAVVPAQREQRERPRRWTRLSGDV